MTAKKKKVKSKMIPCDCPKGGEYSDGIVCPKCNGSEWIEKPAKKKAPKKEKKMTQKDKLELAFTAGIMLVFEATGQLLHYRKSKVFTGYIVSPEAYDLLRKALLKLTYYKFNKTIK